MRRGADGSDAQAEAIHVLARSALDAGHLNESGARAWLMAQNPRLRHDRYFQHVFFDIFGMQLTYRRLRQILG